MSAKDKKINKYGLAEGDHIMFQFDDDGVVRHADGTFKELVIGGMAKVVFKHTNIEVITLPWAVKKV